ncbi:hypothetical protein Taro_014580 [Colocasia esculenta]|uniref:Uncharacterized protein n=1 Tax=Colocasia esculenta TaxID=4460 RepID=A0A843UJG9_COLES|nr:hypothetical protein [Colocasia esculenta]
MSSRSGSRVRRLQTVDGVPSHSSEDSIAGHPSQALLPITQGASSAASASSFVVETPSWGRGTGRWGPSRGATERRLEPGHKWNVRVIGGYGVGEQGTNFISRMGIIIRLHCKIWQKFLSKLLEETKNGIFRDLEHYKGKTFEDAVAFVPPGVDPSDWQTMCEKWNTKEKQVKTHQRESDHMEVFRMGRCKDLLDGTQRWVDDKSNDHFERMTQMTTPSL